MKAIIPAAGSGTRLRPHTHTMPKALIYVAGKPILGYILDALKETRIIDRLGLIVGDKGEDITNYVESNYDFKLDQVSQEKREGLGHAIHLYLSKRGFTDEPLLIVLSDTVFEADLADLTDMLNSQYSCIGVKEVDNPRRFGVVELEGEFIKRLVEKPSVPVSNLAIVGIYLIKNVPLLFHCLLELIGKRKKSKGEYQLTDALQLMLKNGEKMTTFTIDKWYDCGTPKTLLQTNRHLLEKQGGEPEIPGSTIIPPVFIAESSKIENCIIGPNVSIAGRSRVAKSIIEDSIINERAVIRNALVRGSLIGRNATFGGRFRKLNIGDSSEITFV
jgi:glucose-1-phosphate thymidylyltransferase